MSRDSLPHHIVVADEDVELVTFVVETLREAGHAVFQAYDATAANEVALALDDCDLVITNTRVNTVPSVALVDELRRRRPDLPVLYLAQRGESTAGVEAQLPAEVRILRKPFSAAELRAAVNALLDD